MLIFGKVFWLVWLPLLYLASQSPRRRQLLELAGIRFGTVDIDIPEARAPGESPEEYVSRVASEKARAGLEKLTSVDDVVVLGADTEVVLDDEVFGKPRDADDAARMLRRLCGRTHRVLSAVWVVDRRQAEHALNITQVTFAQLSDAQIAAYVASGECMGKAGAYAIQGRAAAFVPHIGGSYSGVMGLPLFETVKLLERFSIGA